MPCIPPVSHLIKWQCGKYHPTICGHIQPSSSRGDSANSGDRIRPLLLSHSFPVILMEGPSRRVNIERVFSLGDDLITILNMKRETDSLMLCLEGREALHSSCEAEFHEVRSSLEDINKKTETCKQQIDEAKDKTVSDEELEDLRNELKEELERENLLHEELSTAVRENIGDLDRQRISIEEQRANMKKKERDELRMQNRLCMCAQVTRVIPDLMNQTSISGYIVDGDNKKFEKFEFESASSSFAICDRLWKMID